MNQGPSVPQVWEEAAIAERILAITSSKTEGMPRITLDSSLDEIGLDSLSTAELVFEIETTFRIKTDDTLLELKTVGEIVGHVKRKLEQAHAKQGS